MASSKRPDGLVYPLPAPPLDTPVEVAPGLRWLRTALPFALDHINIWIADDGPSWTVIDTGVGDRATRELWTRLLAGELAAKPVGRVLLTHFHPDHAGQAGWLCRATGAPLTMSRTEWLTVRALALDDTESYAAAGERHDRLAGLDPELTAARRGRGNYFRHHVVEPPASFTRVQGGDELAMAGSRWTVLVGEGHAPEQVTLGAADRPLLIAADQILPRISPVVGVWSSQPDADPLADFLRSLVQYRSLPQDTLVLPSHGLPFINLHERLDQLAAHHEERLARTLELVSEPATPATAAHVMRGLFTRPLDLKNVGFALAETLAHLNCLLFRGEISRHLEGELFIYARR